MIFSQHQKNNLIAELERALIAARNMPIGKDCDSCINNDAGFCRLAGIKPPAEVRRLGCEAYKFDPDSPPF